MADETIWYACYGSNMLQQSLERYVPSRERASTWVKVPYVRYYAGISRVWDNGGVAFLSLNQTPETISHVRLFQLTLEELHQVWEAENGMVFQYDYQDALSLPAGDYDTAPIPIHDAAGKYNALLRLDDHEGLPVFTVTSDRLLPYNRPADGYRWKVTEGLIEHLEEQAAFRELGLVSQGVDNRIHLPLSVFTS